MLFQPFGELLRIDMKRNYAFVQFATVEQAKNAKEATNGGKLDQSAITVEYVARRMSDERRTYRDSRPRDDYRGRSFRDRGHREFDRGPPDYGRRDDRGRRGGRFDDGPPRDRRGGFRGEDRVDDRLGGRGGPRSSWRDERSPDRFDYDRRRPSSRSRSRSPPGYRRPRGGRDSHFNGRDRDDYRGRDFDSDRRGARGGYDRAGGRERNNDRDYDYKRGRSGGGGAGYERDRGYRSDERGYGGRGGEAEGGDPEVR